MAVGIGCKINGAFVWDVTRRGMLVEPENAGLVLFCAVVVVECT